MATENATRKGIPMNHRTPPPLTLRTRAAVALLALLGSTGACAAAAYYHDGTTQRTITLDSRWVAVITPADSAAASQARTTQTTPPLVTLQHANQPLTRAASSQVTPVYREGNSPAGRLMTLPGGVLVKLNPEWTDTQARAWATNKGLSVSQRLNITGNWYLLASTPGNAALELANQLHASGEVLSATPNWWKQTKPR